MDRNRPDFDWNAANIEHIARHRVVQRETEQAILDPNAVVVDIQNFSDEERTRVVGITAKGRLLAVVFTIRDGAVRPITARDANRRAQMLSFRGREQ